MTSGNTLIFINGKDSHAFAVNHVMSLLGHCSYVVNTENIPNGQSITVKYSGDDIVIGGNEFSLRLGDVTSSWNRRTSRMFSLPAHAHPADFEYIRTNSAAVLNGFIGLVDGQFAVNPLAAVRNQSNKLLQLKAARAAGIRIPRTIVSNNVDDIRGFLSEVDSACVKGYYSHGWNTDDGMRQSVTSRVTADVIKNRASLEISPNIYQEYIIKKAEYRVTIFAGFHTALKIDSKSLTGFANVDWRADPSYLNFTSPASLPDHIIGKCRAVLVALGLRFGTFDIAETFDGEFVFLEVNEAGQWLWKELQCPECKILQPFCEYMISADDKYTWDENRWSAEFSADKICAAIAEDGRYNQKSEAPPPDEKLYLGDERIVLAER